MVSVTHYKPKFFRVEELVPKVIFDRFKEASLQFLDPRILIAADNMRKRFGPILINTWHEGGPFDSRGFRTPSDPDGAQYSLHKQGKALDLQFLKVSPGEVRAEIRMRQRDFEFVTCVEDNTPTWLHIDCRNCKPILWVPHIRL